MSKLDVFIIIFDVMAIIIMIVSTMILTSSIKYLKKQKNDMKVSFRNERELKAHDYGTAYDVMQWMFHKGHIGLSWTHPMEALDKLFEEYVHDMEKNNER